MAKQKYFISQKQIKEIVKHYGTLRKWEYHPNVRKEYYKLTLRSKENHRIWFVIEYMEHELKDNGIKVEVHFTDDKGYISKRDKWFAHCKGDAEFLNVTHKGKYCNPVW